MITDPRIAKLPTWAQNLIAGQARQIDFLSDAVALAQGADPRPAVGILNADSYKGSLPIAFDIHDRVRFANDGTLDADGHAPFWIEVSKSASGPGIEIRGLNGSLSITPVVSNVIRVAVDERY